MRVPRFIPFPAVFGVFLLLLSVPSCSQMRTLRAEAKFILWDEILRSVAEATSPRLLYARFRDDKKIIESDESTPRVDGSRISAIHAHVKEQTWKWSDGKVFVFYDEELRELTRSRVLRYHTIKAALATRRVSEGKDGMILMEDGWERLLPDQMREVLLENRDREAFVDALTTQVIAQSIEQKVNYSLREAESAVRAAMAKANR